MHSSTQSCYRSRESEPRSSSLLDVLCVGGSWLTTRELLQAMWQPLAQGRVLSVEAERALVAYDWPGNLRQLAACLRTLVALTEPGAVIDMELLPEHLHQAARRVAAAPVMDGSLQELALDVMRQTLAACDGNVSLAAKRLGVNRSTLYRRLKL